MFHEHAQEVGWHWVLWQKYAIPKHAMLSWLAIHVRLATTDRLSRFANKTFQVWAECAIKTHQHLFFACPIACEIIKKVMQRMLLPLPVYDLTDILQVFSIAQGKQSVPFQIRAVVLCGCIYAIWLLRNRVKFSAE